MREDLKGEMGREILEGAASVGGSEKSCYPILSMKVVHYSKMSLCKAGTESITMITNKPEIRLDAAYK